MRNVIIFICFLACLDSSAQSQELQFKAKSDTNTYSINERFEVSFSLNALGEDFEAPSFSNFQVISGPNKTTNMAYTTEGISQSTTFIYFLKATKPGSYVINPATIYHDEGQVKSNALTIVIRNDTVSKSKRNLRETEEFDVFLRARATRNVITIDESTTVIYELYTSNSNISNIFVKKYPSFDFFWKEDVKPENTFKEVVELNGIRYTKDTFYIANLSPLKLGSLTIDSMELDFTMRIQLIPEKTNHSDNSQDFFHDFFRSKFIDTTITVKSNPVKVKVIPAEEKQSEIYQPSNNELKKLLSEENSMTNTEFNFNNTFFLLDVSGSMSARDLAPNRIDATKSVMQTYLSKRHKGNHIGLVKFAGESNMLVDLTSNKKELQRAIENLSIDSIEDGTAMGSAMYMVLDIIKTKEVQNPQLVIITDGNNNSGNISPITAATIAKKLNCKLYVIGLSSYNDETLYPYLINDSTVYHNAKVYFDEMSLKDFAEAANGKYFRASSKDELREILHGLELH